MKKHSQVVIIGGGVVGCSVLYHLTKFGCTEVVLCERKELTAGSSWHAAGQIHALNSDPSVARLQGYTLSLYQEIQEVSGQNVGLHITGGLLVAESPDRWDFLRAECARQQVLGASTELMDARMVRELCPIMDTSAILGALYDPREGHVDPSGATQAYAKAACLKGAEVYRHTRVLSIEDIGSQGWRVNTEHGSIECEHVINAAGLWAREVGQMAGIELPLIPIEHHYIVTDELEGLKRLPRELPGVLDLDGGIYLRQERMGMLLGVYEKEATPWAVNGTPWDLGECELLAPQLDRLTDSLERGFRRFPSLGSAGLRRVVNGPFTFTPDGNPLVGPVPGLRNYWAACGVMAGFSQGGGVGLSLAQWIVNREPSGDIYAMDVARFGPFATRPYTIARAREFYSRRFDIAYPNEHLPAGRPAKVSPIHAYLKSANAIFGATYGLEYPRYFSPLDAPSDEVPTFRRSNAFSCVRQECDASRTSVGILDISSFARYDVLGPRAEEALDYLLAAKLPDVGRMRLTPMLAPSGRLMGDFATMRLGHEHFRICGSGYLQSWHLRWFSEHIPNKDVLLRNVTDEVSGLALVGPRSREMLEHISGCTLSTDSFPFLATRLLDLRFAPATVVRVSVTGELGYEIYVPSCYLTPLLGAVLEIAPDLGARFIGMYALHSMRLEKGFGVWSREFSPDYTAKMSGLARFIAYEKARFIGKDASTREREQAPRHRLVTLSVDALDSDAVGYEPIWLRERIVGFVTSGGYGHRVERSLAMGYLSSEVPDDQPDLTVSLLGERRPCRVHTQPPYDPSGARMRS